MVKRKIPARKHHGVRDPLKQLEIKEKKLKNIVNSPPEPENDQKVSFKFLQFKKLADIAKTGKKLKRLHSGVEDKPAVTKTELNKNVEPRNRFRNIKQFIDENDAEYLRRVNRMTTASLREAEYEAKYGVNVVHDAKTGAISIKKRPLNEIDQLLKQKRHTGKVGRKGKTSKMAKPINPKLAKELINQAIKEDNDEQTRLQSFELKEFVRDEIKFGETVHAPPTLSTLPRKALKNDTVPRPGRKNNLLLKSLFSDKTDNMSRQSSYASAADIRNSKKKTISTKAQLKGKRKDLPAATRSMLESEQNKFIELYRQLKKTKDKA